ncbi:formyl transferase [Helicosporidium sp. ATCC 50920]|nr:formyl transferase [Helicosporidium sp. ATCC 50920]|eukprot:KDD74662.1 formyl transferase [Helicosporidium sp. ATCC 50920]
MDPDQRRCNLVFFGTPPVAARVLERLWACQESHNLRVVGVVTQPPRPQGRGRQVTPSAVGAAASRLGLDSWRLLTPVSASDPAFATLLREELRPDVCLTAAYGQYLPSRVLLAPPLGTLNLHPSLLPLYRGAAPVQRALLDGRARSGCSVLFSVREMDAGPLWAQRVAGLGEAEGAEELQERLLNLGLDAFLERLPALRAFGSAQEAMEKGCRQQDHAAATHAPKLRAEEAELYFALPARSVHWSVRALQGWPGAFARVEVERSNGRGWEPRLWKVLRSSMVEQEEEEANGPWVGSEPNLEKSEVLRLLSSPLSPPVGTVRASSTWLRVRCGDGRWLQLEEWVEGGRRAVEAAAFLRGLGHSADRAGRRVRWAPDPDWRSGM